MPIGRVKHEPGMRLACRGAEGLMSIPVGFADPGEIADIGAYLASPAARSVTGAAWTVDKGADARRGVLLKRKKKEARRKTGL
jgi:NAD(P)-dependent dehydrogenase (short-subunit alcohol dehydrogenase family)